MSCQSGGDDAVAVLTVHHMPWRQGGGWLIKVDRRTRAKPIDAEALTSRSAMVCAIFGLAAVHRMSPPACVAHPAVAKSLLPGQVANLASETPGRRCRRYKAGRHGSAAVLAANTDKVRIVAALDTGALGIMKR